MEVSNTKEKIIDLLRKHPEGFPILDIAKHVGAHRHTVTKYVYELIGADMIQCREIGTAKVCILKEKFAESKEKEKEALEKLRKNEDSYPTAYRKAQIRIIPAVLIVLLALGAAVELSTHGMTGFFSMNGSEITNLMIDAVKNIQTSVLETISTLSTHASTTQNARITGSETNNATHALGKQVNLGDMEITVQNVSEFSFRAPNPDGNDQAIAKKYQKVYIKVFNNFSRITGIYDLRDNELLNISLEDSMGNSYWTEDAVPFFSTMSNLFGNSMEIMPSSGREGYLLFPETAGVPEKLTVRIKSGAEAEFGLI